MRRHHVLAILLLVACKPRSEPKPVVHDDARTADAAAVVAIDAAQPVDAVVDAASAPPIDGALDTQGNIYGALDIAFEGKRPPLAYVGPGNQVAVFYYDARSIYQPTACGYRIYKLSSTKIVQTLELVDDMMKWTEPLPDATVATLKQRAAAITAKIGSWQPLGLVRDWEVVPRTHVGPHGLVADQLKAAVAGDTFVALDQKDGIRVELHDAASALITSADIRSFDTKQTHQEDEASLPCSYSPSDVSLYADAKRLLVGIAYTYSIDCDDQGPTWRLWSLTAPTP
ncbi:MAG TPA: hypothetical protein VL326_26895 [Kofleriaceae bacterium]|nr:hypothetical protein [Kofleriaceae bacterium]